MSNKAVDANLRFCDNNAYARKQWLGNLNDSHSYFVNDHSIPVRLKYLCYLYASGNELQVRGYDLGNQLLVPGQRAKISNKPINSEFTSKKSLISWYEYRFDCDDSYLEEIVQGLTSGVGSVPTQKLAITMIQAEETFEQYGIYLLMVTIRSRYFDPEGEETITHTYEITSENPSVDCAPLYLFDEEARSGDTLPYDFRITLVSTTGDVFEDKEWRDPEGIVAAGKIFIGASVIESLIADQQ